VSGGTLALAALVLAAGGWGLWWRRIQRVDVPLRPWAYWIAMGASCLLALLAFANGPGLLGGIGAALALLLGGMYLGLALISTLPTTPMALAVGQPAPDFTAPDSTGAPFTLSSLRGRPVLLKFFRGHW
jgi:hypothetical protein